MMGDMSKLKHTERGFPYFEYKDIYGVTYSIQQSSLATKNALWVGVDDPDPQCMASDAASLGVQTDQTTGWVKYPVSDKVLMRTRMHLDRRQVKNLIKKLQAWIDTGELK